MKRFYVSKPVHYVVFLCFTASAATYTLNWQAPVCACRTKAVWVFGLVSHE